MLLLRFSPLTVPAVTDWLLSYQRASFHGLQPSYYNDAYTNNAGAVFQARKVPYQETVSQRGSRLAARHRPCSPRGSQSVSGAAGHVRQLLCGLLLVMTHMC